MHWWYLSVLSILAANKKRVGVMESSIKEMGSPFLFYLYHETSAKVPYGFEFYS